MSRQTLGTKKMTIAAIAALAIAVQAIPVSAANNANASSASQQSRVAAASPAAVADQFEAYLKQGQISKAYAYLKAHILEAGKTQATVMTLHLENAVKKQLPAYQKRFEAAAVQKGIGAVYKKGDDFDKVIAKTKDKQLKLLLMSARDSGYQLETAEGFYFPVVNYTKFKAFADWVSSDISTYIWLMSVESEQAPQKDAALVIGYQQLVNRAISQEKFIATFPHSNRIDAIRNLFHSYRMLTFYGANNTPLFGYENDSMQPNAKKAYTALLQWNDPEPSAYLTLLRDFMNVVADNGYKLNEEVAQFRKVRVPNT